MRVVALLCLLLNLVVHAQVWEPLGGPLAVRVFAVKANSNDVLFFITPQGMHRSLDDGDTWELLNNGLPDTGLSDLLVAPNDHVFVFGPGNLLYRSIDDGSSWSVLNNGQSFVNGQCLASAASGVLFMGMGGPWIQRSNDDGDTWSMESAPASDVDVVSAGLGDTLFAGYNNTPFSGGALRTYDGGTTWTTMYYGFGPTQTNCLAVNASGHVFAGIEGGTGLVRSTDGGTTWAQLDIGYAREVLSITFNSIGHVLLCSFTSGVLRSTDNGDTWSLMNNGLGAQYTSQVAVNSSDHLFAASSLDLFRSTDGGLSWSGTNDSVVRSGIRSIHVNDSNHYFVSVSGGILHRSIDGGGTWQAVNAGLTGTTINDVVSTPNGHLLAATSFGHLLGGIFGSDDNGDTWNLLTDTTEANVNGIAATSNGDLFASTEGPYGVARSADNGNTWTNVFQGQNPCFTFDELEVGANDVLFAEGNYCGDLLYSTADGGSNWTMHELAPGGGSAIMTAISVRTVGTLLAARDWVQGPHVFRSDDNGLTWQPASYGLPDTTVNVLLCHPTPGLSLAGTPLGVFITNNDGDDWWPFSDGLTNLNVTALAIDQNGYALAGTAGGGVFRAALPVSVAEVDASRITLEQNVPNPCSDITSIAYTLRNGAQVKLSLVDAHGRTVAQLVDGTQSPGRHTVAVPTARLAPGLYAYMLSVDGQRLTKRMLVVR